MTPPREPPLQSQNKDEAKGLQTKQPRCVITYTFYYDYYSSALRHLDSWRLMRRLRV